MWSEPALSLQQTSGPAAAAREGLLTMNCLHCIEVNSDAVGGPALQRERRHQLLEVVGLNVVFAEAHRQLRRGPRSSPWSRLSIFDSAPATLVIPSRARFFRERSRAIKRSDFFFPRSPTHRFALIAPRIRFGLRPSHLVGMTDKGTRENRQPLVRGRKFFLSCMA